MTIACFSRKRNGHVLCFKMKTHYHLGQVSAKKSHMTISSILTADHMTISFLFQQAITRPYLLGFSIKMNGHFSPSFSGKLHDNFSQF